MGSHQDVFVQHGETTEPPSPLAAYLARDRLLGLSGQADLPESTYGVAVLTDIVGFTALTEFLHDRHGPRDGADMLIRFTNQVYDCLIREVERYGGSVIDFAGDAILCWFDGADREAQLRAVAAALAMNASAPACAGFAPAGWNVDFAVKVSIAAGPARRMALGNPEIQRLDAIAGTAIDRLAELDALVRPGVVVADRASLGAAAAALCWDGEQPHVVTGLVDAVAPRALPSPAVPAEAILPWVAAPIRRQVADAQQAGFMCEIRRAVVVFLQFERRDYQHEAAAASLLDAFVRHAQEVAHGLAGHLLQLSLSDKGNYLYLVFGAPVAHEHAARHAIHAALALLAPHPATAPFGRLRGGIASGYARIGIYGSAQRQAYGVIGGAVNLAARLMQAARPGELLAPIQLAATAPDVVAQPRGPLQLKGMAAPCQVACLALDDSEPGRRTPIMPDAAMPFSGSGHTAALAALDALLARVPEGAGATVVVEGPAGMGKSVLLQTAIHQARTRGIDVALAGANELEQTTLYAVWTRIFASLFPSDADLAAAIARLDGDPTQAAALVAHSLRRGAPNEANADANADTIGIDDMAPQMRAHATRAVLCALVCAAARRAPLVLVLEDAHWFDSASLSLLAEVANAGAPLLLVVSTRGPGAEALPGAQRIRLDHMPSATLLEIACARIGAQAMADDAARFLLDKAGGNPFFAGELALALVELGTLEVTQGLCRLGAGAELRNGILPDSIEGVVTAGLDRLTPEQLNVVKLASAVGAAFDAPLLAGLQDGQGDLSGESSASVGERLAELAALDVLAPDEDLPGGYRFRHAIVRDVAYHLMLSSQRSRLHRWLALWVERSQAGRLDTVLPVLAGHWARVAADPAADHDALERAVALLHRAALQAFRANALGETAAHLQSALALLPRCPSTSATVTLDTELQSLLAYCLSTQRGFGDPAVEQAYRRGYALAQRVDLTPTLGFSLYGLFSFYASRAEYEPARHLAAQMLSLGEAADDPAICAFAHHSSGIIAFLGADAEGALAALDRSAALAADLAPDAFFGFASELPIFNSAWQILALASARRFDAARASFTTALQAAAQAPHAQAFVLCFAMLPVWERDVTATLHHCDTLDALSARHGFHLYAAVARIYRGWALAVRDGDPAGAALADSGLPLLRAVQLHSFLPMFLGLAAQAHRSAGDAAIAHALQAEAQALVAAAGGGFHCTALTTPDAHP